ncbi:MAG: DEAD/DEAH box helicase [Psychroserpens sp.]|nr:DEAD/DEAH box helicase [Psychroserpens sp.]
MSFKDFNLDAQLLTSIDEAGYSRPTPVQIKSIPLVLKRKDLIVSAQTGTGKTAAFALPMLQLLFENKTKTHRRKVVRALAVSPTRELAIQTAKHFKIFSKNIGLKTAVIFGGTEIEPQKQIIERGLDVLVATPGRLLDLHKQDLINLDHTEILVLDEADIMLDMGFIEDVRKIERLCPPEKQTLLFSATIPYKVEQLASAILKQPERINIATNTMAEQVEQRLYYVPKRYKIPLCLHILKSLDFSSLLIFRRTKFGVEKLYERLKEEGYTIERLHGNKSQKERQNALADFKRGKVRILVATDVAARGIDIKELDVVINFDIPNVAETYVHRIGRTGRAGLEGLAISLCSADEKNYITHIESYTNVPIPVIEDHPHVLSKNAKPEVHRKPGSKHKKGRKGQGSKKKKRRWY